MSVKPGALASMSSDHRQIWTGPSYLIILTKFQRKNCLVDFSKSKKIHHNFVSDFPKSKKTRHRHGVQYYNLDELFTNIQDLLISLERVKLCGSPRFEIKLNDQELANRHWPSCAADSTKAWSQTRRAFDDSCVELAKVAQEGQWRFASSLSFNLISKREEPHKLTLSNYIGGF